MADIKWIKIVVDIFDDEKILLIESMPEADAVLCIWFKILCLAGKVGTNGVLLLNNRIAFTDEMLATIFRRPLNTVRMALNIFQSFDMIEIIEGAITIPNWPKHQNMDQIEKKRLSQRELMKKRREQQRISAKSSSCEANSEANRKANVSSLELEGELEGELERELEREIEEDIVYLSEPILDSGPKVISLILNTKKEYPIFQKQVDEWQSLYPAVDIISELRKMLGWLNANPTKRKTKHGILRFVNNWLAKQQDKGHVGTVQTAAERIRDL
jgi:predicted phage replisome organizer